jgi:hypothetical protein
MCRVLCVLAFALFNVSASAATLEKLKSIDINPRNGFIDAGLEFTEYLKIEELAGKTDSKSQARIGTLQAEIARRGKIPIEELAQQKPPQASGCDKQVGFYVRRDSLDISIYNKSIDKSAAKGAAISYTSDRITDTEIAQIQCIGSLVFARDPCPKPPPGHPRDSAYISGFAFATSVSADGKLSTNRKTEKSALKTALDAQIEVAGTPFLALHALTASPFYQTDFRGIASAYGFSASWVPYDLDWRLGGSYQQFSPALDFFWQAKLEAVRLRVEDAGLTNLKLQDYAWVGGTFRLNLFPFPDFFKDRVSLIGGYQYYYDTQAHANIELTSALIAYNLAEDGSTSISLEYRKGVDRDTLERLNRYMVNLNFKL